MLSVRQVLHFHLNGHPIQLFMCLPALLHPGFGGRIQWLGGRFRFLIGVCVCLPHIQRRARFFSGGGGGVQMKGGLNEWRQPKWKMWFIKDTREMNGA